MAIPQDRKVIFSSHAVPQESYVTADTRETTEEGIIVGRAPYTKYKLDSTINKTFGGKGVANIATDQGTDNWTSMMHSKVFWEMLGDDTATSGNLWEDMKEPWDGILTLSAEIAFSSLIPTVNISFIYIKNTGSVETVKLNLNDIGYDILIPPGAAVSMRLAASIPSNKIKVDTVSGTTTIEYIIAD